MMKFPLIFIMTVFFVNPAFAQTWVLLGRYKSKIVTLNPKLTRVYGNIIQVSLKVKEKGKTKSTRLAFDCANNGVMQIQVRDSQHLFGSWDNFYKVKPNTFGYWLKQNICN